MTNDAGPDDAVVLRRIADGDVAALGDLFDKMARPVYSLVMQLLRSHDAAEDIVESTFWQAWQEAGVLADTPDPREWLLATGRRRALEQLRSRRHQREELLMDKRQFADLVSAGADASRMDFVQRLRNMDPEDRLGIELGYFRGLSQGDIADITGEPPQTIKTRMRSALETLRRPDAAQAE